MFSAARILRTLAYSCVHCYFHLCLLSAMSRSILIVVLLLLVQGVVGILGFGGYSTSSQNLSRHYDHRGVGGSGDDEQDFRSPCRETGN